MGMIRMMRMAMMRQGTMVRQLSRMTPRITRFMTMMSTG